MLVLNCDDDADLAGDTALQTKLQDHIMAFYTYLKQASKDRRAL